MSGQLSINAKTGEPVTDSIVAQTKQYLRNVEAVLLTANSDLNHVLKMTVYISDKSLWSAVGKVYARVLGEHKSARVIIPVGKFGGGNFSVKIDAIAALKNKQSADTLAFGR